MTWFLILGNMAAVWRRLFSVAPQCSRVIQAPPVFINRSKLYEPPHQLGGIHRRFCSAKPLPQKDKVTVHFMMADGEKRSVQAKVGDNLLDVIIENDVDVDGFGACEGTLACSTCHLIFSPADFKKLPEKPTDEELDMLDLAFSLTDESRLGCQVIVSKEMEGWEIKVPEGVADAREP